MTDQQKPGARPPTKPAPGKPDNAPGEAGRTGGVGSWSNEGAGQTEGAAETVVKAPKEGSAPGGTDHAKR